MELKGGQLASDYKLEPVNDVPSPQAEPVEICIPQHSRVALGVKRVCDVIGSSLLLILVLPLFPVIALAIFLTSPGPLFFKPRIIGYKGREFWAYKFRTMYPDAFERLLNDPELLAQYKIKLKVVDDPRVTPLGRILRRTSLDELPQLINVWKGDMSLVGPRMLAKLELDKFGQLRDKILSMRPGMAGLWVASGRQNVSFERRKELELQYIDEWSLGLDAKCFIKTIGIALRMTGAH
jgi:lipopolysaccharide/colanic/teichoic acid biosynthesis glycosyltransferase